MVIQTNLKQTFVRRKKTLFKSATHQSASFVLLLCLTPWKNHRRGTNNNQTSNKPTVCPGLSGFVWMTIMQAFKIFDFNSA